MEQREPKLGVAIGRKGCGKTFTSRKMIQRYIVGNPAAGIVPRRVLILDVNDEYEDINALSLSDVVAFSKHKIVEARRIRPFHPDGKRMGITDIQEALFKVLNDFRGGMLMIEDINRYVSDNLPNDLIGAICTNRHSDLDIILHFQSIGRISPKIWQNINFLRFHKITDAVKRHEKKFEDKLEMLQLAEAYINMEYNEGNQRYFCYVDIDDEKIRGVERAKFTKVIHGYLSENYSRLISPKLRQVDMNNLNAKKPKPQDVVKNETDRILKYYLD